MNPLGRRSISDRFLEHCDDFIDAVEAAAAAAVFSSFSIDFLAFFEFGFCSGCFQPEFRLGWLGFITGAAKKECATFFRRGWRKTSD